MTTDAAPITLDEYIGDDLPDPDVCPYCAETMQENCHAVTWQPVTIVRDANGDLDVGDYGSLDWEVTSLDEYSCRGYSHHFATLEQLDREQREQHALDLWLSADDESDESDEPAGVVETLAAVYGAPIFQGRRSRMARTVRAQQTRYRSQFDRAERWARFIALDTPPTLPADEAERDLITAGVLAAA